MYPIYIKKLRTGKGMHVQDFARSFKTICASHQEEGRASAFAFILHDFKNPEITKVLDDHDYFRALDNISGNNLTVFYLHLSSLSNKNIEFLQGDRHIYDLTQETNKFLQDEFGLSENIKTPAILFFQVKNKLIIDYFIVQLTERTVEKSFLEIEELIQEIARTTERITIENKENYKEIFDLIKINISGLKSIKTTKSSLGSVYKFGKIILFIERIVSTFV